MNIQPKNIAKKVGIVRLQSDYVNQWKNNIRISRQVDIRQSPEIADVYRSDANDLLALSTKLNKNCSFEDAKKAINSLDSNVRELVPNEVYNIIFKS
jgi:hypothetical protein